MFDDFLRKQIDTGDAVINCVVGGSGPPLLLLHGYPQTHAMWAKVAPQLAKIFTVVCADLRGYGDSSKPTCLPDNANYAFRVMARDQLNLMAALGFKRFHLVGHDRGARTSYRLALDHPDAVASLAVLDIVPTYAMFRATDRVTARLYWHWFFLTLPTPFPEHLIAGDPDFFYQNILGAWGGAHIAEFDEEQLAAYRRCWRTPEMIHGSCSDYRAGATIDREHDLADLEAGRKIACPTLALWGARGAPVASGFDVAAEWRKFCTDLYVAQLDIGHFFIDQRPDDTVRELLAFLNGPAPKI